MKDNKDSGFIAGLAKMLLVPAAFTGLYFLFASSPEMAATAVRLFSRPARDFLGTVFSAVPVSAAEILIAGAVVYAAVYLVRTLIQIFKGELVNILKRTAVLIVVAAYLGAGYLCLWGIDYRAPSFRERTGLTGGVTTQQLYNAAEFFVSRANSLAGTVERGADGSFSGDAKELLGDAPSIYGAVQARFPELEGSLRKPKALVFSELMSYTGFTGIFFPYTGESNVNVAQPAIFVPMTAAHELAHQLGVTDEDACNAIGVSACVTCGNAVYRYSGYLNGSIYLLRALAEADSKLYTELCGRIKGNMARDFNENSAYWYGLQQSNTARIATETMETVYDAYLKVNGVESGFASYGQCVDLIVRLYNEGFYK